MFTGMGGERDFKHVLCGSSKLEEGCFLPPLVLLAATGAQPLFLRVLPYRTPEASKSTPARLMKHGSGTQTFFPGGQKRIRQRNKNSLRLGALFFTDNSDILRHPNNFSPADKKRFFTFFTGGQKLLWVPGLEWRGWSWCCSAPCNRLSLACVGLDWLSVVWPRF